MAVSIGSVKALDDTGRDLLDVFSRAHAGKPLRAVAMGGSITQAGEGWVGEWLRGQFPKSVVTMHNAGMSATGSDLGVFRIERDVIACQPDLVFIEFAVNDGALSDVDAIRYVESLVVRLKSLEHPPAIVFLETAARGGSNRGRHQQVARHYGLVDVDLQNALDAHLLSEGFPWEALLSDDVHPNEKGHAFYANAISEKLGPFVERSKSVQADAKKSLPPRLSCLPLVLDGRMQALATVLGWEIEPSPPFWWGRVFTGMVGASQPGSTMLIPFRGTSVGLLYGLDKTYGEFLVSVDGTFPTEVNCHFRNGYEYRVLGMDLEPQEHLLTIALPRDRPAAPVKLGYLLLSGETGARRDLTIQGEFTTERMSTRVSDPIPASAWEWIGPFGSKERTHAGSLDLDTPFIPEPPEGWQEGSPDEHPETLRKVGMPSWQRLSGEGEEIDFARLTGLRDRGVCYARTRIMSAHDQRLYIRWALDYFGKLWVNGTLVKTVSEAHGSPWRPLYIPVFLHMGENDILVKIQSGSQGNWFSMAAQQKEPFNK